MISRWNGFAGRRNGRTTRNSDEEAQGAKFRRALATFVPAAAGTSSVLVGERAGRMVMIVFDRIVTLSLARSATVSAGRIGAGESAADAMAWPVASMGVVRGRLRASVRIPPGHGARVCRAAGFGLGNRTRPKKPKVPRRDSVVHLCRPLSWKRERLRSTQFGTSGWAGILDRLHRPSPHGPEDAFLGATDPHPGRQW